ncbi:MAG: A24 family peptidase [Phycisphaerales bacterium]
MPMTWPNLWLLNHLPSMIFVFCVGAAVGSFLNVVVHRLPAGMSLVDPPSRCPICGVRLGFFRENLPILGWIMIRGKCRTCKAPVSVRYMLVEVLMALVFLGLYAMLYLSPSSAEWLRNVGGPWWYGNGFLRTWPAFFSLAFMVSGLYAMTVIDARTFTIPIEIPRFTTIASFVLLGLQAVILSPPRPATQSWATYGVDWPVAGLAIGGMLGMLLSWALLSLRVFKYSFADYDDYVDDGETIGDYPHARREMKHEVLFVIPILIAATIGWFGTGGLEGPPAPLVQALAGAGLGYLVGGGIVWAVRILGTLAFGREAMGMGDVHLLAAVGVVVGWPEALLVFFVAPFSALLVVFLGSGAQTLFKTRWHHLPFGPHLAVATVIVILGRPGFQALMEKVWGFGFPLRGFV